MDDEPVAGRVPARVLSLAWATDLFAGTSKGTIHRLSGEDDRTVQLPQRFAEPVYSLVARSGRELLAGTSNVEVVRLDHNAERPVPENR